jgi:hypothetical protein
VKKYIVITTINEPTEAIIKFSEMKDWELIIVGDLKTPHDSYKNIRCSYFSPKLQESLYPKISKIIGWNTSVRRNLGFIEAYNRGADIIALTDDDNIPYDFWGQNMMIGKEVTLDYWTTSNKVFDPLFVTDHPHLWHRGYPITDVGKRNAYYSEDGIKIKPLIQVDLWDGNPDVDALERMIFDISDIKLRIDWPFCTNKISPFDSQNTFISRDLIKYFMLISGVGRVDDIWGSYLLQMTYKSDNPYIVYSRPSVYQKRNEHDLLDDFNLEVYGYNNTTKFLNKTLDKYSSIMETYAVYQSYFN